MGQQEIISALDDEPLSAQAAQVIAFEIIKHAGFNDPVSLQLMNDFREGRLTPHHLTPDAEAVSAKRLDYDLPRYERSKNFLLGCLITDSERLDGYFAEHIFAWAADVGVSNQVTESIFKARMRRIPDVG